MLKFQRSALDMAPVKSSAAPVAAAATTATVGATTSAAAAAARRETAAQSKTPAHICSLRCFLPHYNNFLTPLITSLK